MEAAAVLDFQQSSLAQLDFEFQWRKRPGAFDLPHGIFGDEAFPKLVQNMKESFARTALELIAAGLARSSQCPRRSRARRRVRP